MKTRPAGFTLFEMLVALAIFSVAASSLILANGQGVRQMDAVQTRMLASWIGENQAVLLQASKAWPAVGETERTEHFARRSWRIVQEIQATRDARLRQFKIQVYEEAPLLGEPSAAVYQLIGYVLQLKPPQR